MIGFIRSMFSKKTAPAPEARPAAHIVPIRAKFDAAQTTPENRNHWANADALSPDAAATPAIRRTVRNRARYEVANNSYAKGLVLTLANDCVGTGPTLQLVDDHGNGKDIETRFSKWSKAIGLAAKLRTMRAARATDGEAFALQINNPALQTVEKLDIKLLEAEQVADFAPPVLPTDRAIDGIVFDEAGNPVEYHVLPYHPGALFIQHYGEIITIPARRMLHFFRADRPGQRRGIPDIMSSLPLFAMLRRYTLATIEAAETAANYAMFMKTGIPPEGVAADVEPLTEIELTRNTAQFIPEGWEPTQMKAEQPTTTYPGFKGEILTEIGRPVSMPQNIVSGNSSAYNYASGRLDHQTYFRQIRIDQDDMAAILDRLFDSWFEEAAIAYGWDASQGTPDHVWLWPGTEHVDPAKEANAQQTKLQNHTTTLADEWAAKGQDWEAKIRQRAKEVALLTELKLPTTSAKPAPADKAPSADPGADPSMEPDMMPAAAGFNGNGKIRRFAGRAV